MQKLSGFLRQAAPDVYGPDVHVHQRCMAHIINLVVKNTLHIIYNRVMTVRMIVSCIRSSVKLRHIYDTVCKELELSHSLPESDIPTRWSFTFRMLEKSHIDRRVLTTTMERIPELQICVISKSEWEHLRRISSFFKQPADITECHSGSSYATLSLCIRLYGKPVMQCQTPAHGTDETIAKIAPTMLQKLNSYHIHINSLSARLASILDSRSRNNLETDGMFLCDHVQLPEPSTSPRHQHKNSIIDELLVDGSSQKTTEDQISLSIPPRYRLGRL